MIIEKTVRVNVSEGAYWEARRCAAREGKHFPEWVGEAIAEKAKRDSQTYGKEVNHEPLTRA